MELIIKLSEKLEAGVYRATEKGTKIVLFYAKTKRECIAQGRTLARLKKKMLLRITDSEGKEIYKTRFFWRENLKL